ncbi:MAG: hypothetical protein AAGJ95_04550 [Cyanobacteria bacterium J06554_11]
MSDYTPVGCGLHDKLEAIATLRRSAQITYRDAAGETTEIESKIVDIYADDGADYCKLDNGAIVRLDRLQSVSAGGEKVL